MLRAFIQVSISTLHFLSSFLESFFFWNPVNVQGKSKKKNSRIGVQPPLPAKKSWVHCGWRVLSGQPCRFVRNHRKKTHHFTRWGHNFQLSILEIAEYSFALRNIVQHLYVVYISGVNGATWGKWYKTTNGGRTSWKAGWQVVGISWFTTHYLTHTHKTICSKYFWVFQQLTIFRVEISMLLESAELKGHDRVFVREIFFCTKFLHWLLGTTKNRSLCALVEISKTLLSNDRGYN